jgi:hypothetical protein
MQSTTDILKKYNKVLERTCINYAVVLWRISLMTIRYDDYDYDDDDDDDDNDNNDHDNVDDDDEMDNDAADDKTTHLYT